MSPPCGRTFAMSPGGRKMPVPTTDPMVSSTQSHRPSPRSRLGPGRGEAAPAPGGPGAGGSAAAAAGMVMGRYLVPKRAETPAPTARAASIKNLAALMKLVARPAAISPAARRPGGEQQDRVGRLFPGGGGRGVSLEIVAQQGVDRRALLERSRRP